MKYYFVSYKWTRHGMNGWVDGNTVIDVHPLEWLKHSGRHEEAYMITFYDEITEEQFEEAYAWID